MPKSTPRAQVPGSGWFHVVDRLFFTVLVLSLACHFGLIAAVAGRAPEEVDAIDETPRWGGFLPPPFFPKPPLKPKQTGVAGAGPRQPRGPAAPRPKLDHAGLLGVIGAMTAGETNGLNDLLAEGAADRSLDDAFKDIDHVAINGPDTGLHSRRGAGTGTATELGALGTGGGGSVDLGHQRGSHIGSSVSQESVEPESKDIDRDAMARFVRAHLRSIQTCYERELKLAPDLKGKLEVRLTLTPAGRVGDVDVEEDTLHNGSVLACIRSVLTSWKLPFHPDVEGAVQLSWNFVAAD
jgi:hypothetical protein